MAVPLPWCSMALNAFILISGAWSLGLALYLLYGTPRMLSAVPPTCMHCLWNETFGFIS